jgi:hypothetical protein
MLGCSFAVPWLLLLTASLGWCLIIIVVILVLILQAAADPYSSRCRMIHLLTHADITS